MKYVVIEVWDGGATKELLTQEELVTFLAKPDCADALRKFNTKRWYPGQWMETGFGWIFCVTK